MSAKESGKFFSGFAANQVLTHGALAISGNQFTIFGIPCDRELNTNAALIWAIILCVLFYFSWIG